MRTIMREKVMDAERVDPHLTARIVGSYVRHHTVGADQVSDLIATVHRALGDLGKPNQPEEVRSPAVSVRRSVSQDYVVCDYEKEAIRFKSGLAIAGPNSFTDRRG